MNKKITGLENFDYYPNLDSPGNDIRQVKLKLVNDDNTLNTENLKKMEEEVLKEDNCIGFNLDGWLKKVIRNVNEWELHSSSRKMGLFIKKAEIPKIFHIIVKNKDEIENNNEIWKNNIFMHQYWEFRLYFPHQIKKYINDKCPEYIKKMNNSNNKLELFKWIILNREGGVYLKHNYKCKRSFNLFIHNEIITDDYIICKKNSKLLTKYI